MFTKVDAPGGKKPTPANPKGDRRSVLSEKKIQDNKLFRQNTKNLKKKDIIGLQRNK